jgi:hypothetical protein
VAGSRMNDGKGEGGFVIFCQHSFNEVVVDEKL